MRLIILLILSNLLYSYTFNYKNMQCLNKHKCSEMKTCKEAFFYLEVCNINSLDRDKDGMPCESLCKNYLKRN